MVACFLLWEKIFNPILDIIRERVKYHCLWAMYLCTPYPRQEASQEFRAHNLIIVDHLASKIPKDYLFRRPSFFIGYFNSLGAEQQTA
jgi:hypothetical protein